MLNFLSFVCFCLSVASIGMIIASLINPKWGTLKGTLPKLFRGKIWNRKMAVKVWATLWIVFFCGFLTFVIMSPNTPDQQTVNNQQSITETNETLLSSKCGLSTEQAKDVANALDSVGLGEIEDITKKENNDYTLDIKAKNTDYNPENGSISITVDKDNNLQSIQYKLVPLWFEGQAHSQISDHLMSYSEERKATDASEKAVKAVLKSPDSADFDSGSYRYIKNLDGVTFFGTVDAQNSFGASIRNSFKVQLKATNDGYTAEHLTMNGNQLY